MSAPKSFFCDFCGKCIKKKKGNLERHILSMHFAVDTKFVCPEEGCGKEYEQARYLKAHQKRGHKGRAQKRQRKEKNPLVVVLYLCPHVDCGKTFVRKSNWVQHLTTHSQLRPHECEKCGKTFKRPAAIRQHRAKNCHVQQEEVEEMEVNIVMEVEEVVQEKVNILEDLQIVPPLNEDPMDTLACFRSPIIQESFTLCPGKRLADLDQMVCHCLLLPVLDF